MLLCEEMSRQELVTISLRKAHSSCTRLFIYLTQQTCQRLETPDIYVVQLAVV